MGKTETETEAEAEAEAEADRDNEVAGGASLVVMTLHGAEPGTVSSHCAHWGHCGKTRWPQWLPMGSHCIQMKLYLQWVCDGGLIQEHLVDLEESSVERELVLHCFPTGY